MKKLSTRSALLFAATTAVCALGVPSIASASSWGVIGTEHTLDSPDLTSVTSGFGGIVARCARQVLTADIQNANSMTITQSFSGNNCTATGPTIGDCTTTWTPTSLPWTATAISTTNIQLRGIHIDLTYENMPGSTSCAINGLKFTVTGTVSNGHWTGNDANQHEIILNDAPGLTMHSFLGNNLPVTLRGTIRDTQQSLTVNP